jgi:hypothetical protein
MAKRKVKLVKPFDLKESCYVNLRDLKEWIGECIKNGYDQADIEIEFGYYDSVDEINLTPIGSR